MQDVKVEFVAISLTKFGPAAVYIKYLTRVIFCNLTQPRT